jgi:hypothetical protein
VKQGRGRKTQTRIPAAGRLAYFFFAGAFLAAVFFAGAFFAAVFFTAAFFAGAAFFLAGAFFAADLAAVFLVAID